jgi:hypothetical protein
VAYGLWRKITGTAKDADGENALLTAIIHRSVSIYREWYDTVGVGELLSFKE